MEYNRKIHSELGMSPLQCYLHDKNVARPCPATEKLRLAFTAELGRTLRRSDSTLTLKGVRFESPPATATSSELWLRYASWDLSTVHLADPKSGAILGRIYPVDKKKNAEGLRAPRTPPPFASRHCRLPARGAVAAKNHPAIRRHRIASGVSAQTTKSAKSIMNKQLLSLYSLKFNPFSSANARRGSVDDAANPKLLLAH